MNTPISIDDLNHEKIRAWLERALRGQESLPLLTKDEFPHLGILRLEKNLKPETRSSLRDGVLQLVSQFCVDGQGETAYLEELLSLVTAFKQPKAAQMLAQLAEKFFDFPNLSTKIRLAVLAVLVDIPPPRSVEFWERIFEQNPEQYAGLVLSGVLAINPLRAIELLPKMPDVVRIGQSVALILDLTWDDLPAKQRSQFVRNTQAILQRCSYRFAGPVRTWVNLRREPRHTTVNPSLFSALFKFLGPKEIDPRWLNSKLCSCWVPEI